ncbi:hypothetical protein [Rhodococcus koreensis]
MTDRTDPPPATTVTDPRQIADHLTAAGVTGRGRVLVHIQDRRTRERVVDALTAAEHTALIPVTATEPAEIAPLAGAVRASAVVADTAVDLPDRAALLVRTPNPAVTGIAADAPAGPGWGVTAEHRWILHAVPERNTFLWSRVPAHEHTEEPRRG